MEYVIRFAISLFDLAVFMYYFHSNKKMKPVSKVWIWAGFTIAAIIWTFVSSIKNPYLNLAIPATADGGDYQYLETWKAAAQDDTAAKTFKLSGAGTARKASIFPTELKGIPNLKLYCVTNSTTLYKADGDPIDPLVAVKTNAATGAIENVLECGTGGSEWNQQRGRVLVLPYLGHRYHLW